MRINDSDTKNDTSILYLYYICFDNIFKYVVRILLIATNSDHISSDELLIIVVRLC